MANYEFQCQSCNAKFGVLAKGANIPDYYRCFNCGLLAARVFSTFAAGLKPEQKVKR